MRSRLGLAVLPLLLAGCISNNNSSPGEDAGQPGEDGSAPPTEDSGQPSQDATLPGDASTTDSAAPPLDAADAGPPPVTLLVTTDVAPEPGVLVLFHDATGAVTGTATTGLNGMVTQQLAANSQVTAVLQGPRGMAFVTIQGVQPGDALTAFDSTNVAFTGSTVTVDLPDASPDGAVSYAAQVGTCSGSGTTSPLTVSNVGFPCELQGKYPMLLTATSSGNQEIGYSYATGNSLPFDGGAAEVAPSTGWFDDETAPQFSIVNQTPSQADGGGYSNFQLQYEEISGNVPYTSTVSTSTNADGGLSAAGLTGHPSYPDSVQVEGTGRQYLYDQSRGAYLMSIVGVAARSTADASVTSIDMSQAPPQLVSALINADDAGTASQPVITWTSLGSLASTDGLIVVAFFSLDFGDGGSVSQVPWSIVLPPSATSATPPALPASVGTPAVISGPYMTPTVMAVEASYLSGYAQMRQAAATLVPPINEFNLSQELFQNYGGGPVAPTLPVDGTLRLSAITLSGD